MQLYEEVALLEQVGPVMVLIAKAAHVQFCVYLDKCVSLVFQSDKRSKCVMCFILSILSIKVLLCTNSLLAALGNGLFLHGDFTLMS